MFAFLFMLQKWILKHKHIQLVAYSILSQCLGYTVKARFKNDEGERMKKSQC